MGELHPAGNVALVTDLAADAAEPTVLVSTSGGLGRLTLNRPRAINALDLDMVRRQHDALDAWEHDTEVDVVLLDGAGKTTTLRILLGLVRATDGNATIGGRRYAELDQPLQTVGAVLEASSFHPGRTAAAHLTIYAQAAGIAKTRVGEVLDLVGLTDAAGRKVGGFSLGMRQRLGLAYALLGDPGVLVGVGELFDGALEHEAPARDDQQRVDGLLHLGEQVRRHEHRAALGRELAEEAAHPADPLGIEAVRRLVEHEHTRIAQQRVRQAEALAHAQ